MQRHNELEVILGLQFRERLREIVWEAVVGLRLATTALRAPFMLVALGVAACGGRGDDRLLRAYHVLGVGGYPFLVQKAVVLGLLA